ncbi:MAG: DUF6745 domain-containing protein, partial [Miltoncostaeaceae bacterium]
MTKKYKLTEEHRARLPEFAEYGIRLALRTDPQTEEERERARQAVQDMYRVAGLTPPPRERIVFVPSPLVGRFAAGFAAWAWYRRGKGEEVMGRAQSATWGATGAATGGGARTAAGAATLDATWAVIDDATQGVCEGVTDDAADDATGDALPNPAPDLSAWYTGLPDMRAIADELGVGEAGMECARAAWKMQQGGNMWSGWICWMEFFRRVAELPIDWSSWMPWLTLAETGGYRWVHSEFCIISDFPTEIHRDAENRPHREDGPFMSWRDGTALYAWHGIYTPAWIIEHPERITVELIEAEENAEVRRVMVERYGATWGAAGGAAERDTWDATIAAT